MARGQVMNDGGFSTRDIDALHGSIAATVTAAGANQATATELTADNSLITTASAGQGVRLPSFNLGSVLIANGTAVAVLVYPVTGGKINNASANAAITLYPGLGVECTAINATDVLAVYVAIPAGSVVTASIADDAVTYAKIQNISASPRILGRKTAAAGDTEECTLSEVLDFIQSATKGDLLVRDTSAWARLAASTSGHVLTAQGAGALPAYAAPAGTITAATVQATTSGTEFDFTGIPAGVNRILVLFDGVSLSGTDQLLVQIGDSGGVETSGYTSGASLGVGSAIAQATSTAGFNAVLNNAARALSGIMTIARITGDTWVASHAMGSSTGTLTSHGGGSKTLSATLDRVRVTRSGTDTFDAGQVNIFYE